MVAGHHTEDGHQSTDTLKCPRSVVDLFGLPTRSLYNVSFLASGLQGREIRFVTWLREISLAEIDALQFLLESVDHYL